MKLKGKQATGTSRYQRERVLSTDSWNGRGSRRKGLSSVVVMAAFGAMNMGRFLGWGCQLSRKHDSAGFVLLGQVFRNLGVKGFDIADHAVQEAA